MNKDQKHFNSIMKALIGMCEHLGPFHSNPVVNKAYIAHRVVGATPATAQIEAIKFCGTQILNQQFDNAKQKILSNNKSE